MECTASIGEKLEQQAGLAISFPWCLPGLDYNEFVLYSLQENPAFYFMHSASQTDIGLFLVNPFVFYKDYEFEISDDVAARLKIASQEDVAVLCTVNTSRGINAATVNLLAPIIINTKQMTARQVILDDGRYSLRTPLALSPGE